MRRAQVKITIGDFTFNDVVSIQNLENSWDEFTDTVVVELRNKFRNNNEIIITGANNVINRGDEVNIWFGYFPLNFNLNPIFKGFVSNVAPDKTVKITCEDSYLLKQINIESHTFIQTTIQKVYDFYLKDTDIEYDVIDADIGDFQVDNNSFVNFIEILKAFKTTHGLHSWFTNGILKTQLAYTDRQDVTHEFFFNGKDANIINSRLILKRDDDFSVFVKGESIQEDNSRIIRYAAIRKGKVVIQDAQISGQQRNIKRWNKTKAELDAIIEREIQLMVFEGYEGQFSTFGDKLVRQGDKVIMKDNKYIDHNGTYLTKKIVSSLTVNGGIRQQIAPERRTS